MKKGNALIHFFNIYCPPDFNKEERAKIFRNLLYAIDFEIKKANGVNHIVVTGDFNMEGMKDMLAIAATRGLTRVATSTHGLGSELDAIFVSKDIKLIQQESNLFNNLSDHAWIVATLQVAVTHTWTDYMVEVPIPMGEKRTKLRSNQNRRRMAGYNLHDGPFALFADLGPKTKRVHIRFGGKPPSGFMPTDPEYGTTSSARIIGIMKARTNKIKTLAGQQAEISLGNVETNLRSNCNSTTY
jgi:hypothetical protein